LRKYVIPLIMVGILVVSGFVTATVPKEKPIIDNDSPYPPNLSGPRFVSPEPIEWTFTAIDPDGDNLYYQINWGDGSPSEGWFGPYASGEGITRNHTYCQYGNPKIGARAKDVYGEISDWGTFDIKVSKCKHIINLPFLQFVMRMVQFPLLQRLLEWLM
jgi:hypothetical protein